MKVCVCLPYIWGAPWFKYLTMTTINDLPYDCLDRVLAVADETQELKREVAELKDRDEHTMDCNNKLKAKEKLMMEYNDELRVREKHLMECNASMTPSVVMERNIILKARETYLLECNAGLKASETILYECNAKLKARETSLMDKNRALEDKLTKMTATRAPVPAPCAAPRPRRSGRLWARRLANE